MKIFFFNSPPEIEVNNYAAGDAPFTVHINAVCVPIYTNVYVYMYIMYIFTLNNFGDDNKLCVVIIVLVLQAAQGNPKHK